MEKFVIRREDYHVVRSAYSAQLHCVAIDSLPMYGDLRSSAHVVPTTRVRLHSGREYVALRPECLWSLR